MRIWQYSSGSWTQIGNDIDGEAAGDNSGYSVSLSSDGTIVAIGDRYTDGTTGSVSDDRGQVRVWQYSSGSWTQLGDDIDGETEGDQSGISVSLSSDGTIVAIGARYNDGTTGSATDNRGHVRVWQRNENAAIGWTQLGDDIDGETTGDESGYSVSLSSDGTIVAIGAYLNNGGGSESGHVRIYKYSNSEWTKLGDDIDGAATGDQSGFSLSLSGNGSTVAIGAPFHGGTNLWEQKGHVRIFETGQPNTVTTTSDVAAIPPTITSLTIASNNTDNTKLAVAADVVTLALVTDININQPTVTFTSGSAAITNAGAITYTGSDNSWTAQYTVDAADTVGEIGFTVDYSSVSTSTSGSQATSSTNESVVNVVASVPPAVSTLTISSNNSVKTTVAVVDDVVTLALVTDISINQPTVTFTSGGVAVAGAITYTGLDNSWTSQYTVDSGDTEGEIGFTVDYSSASSSTSGPQATSATDGKSVNVILPTGIVTQIPPEVTNLSVSTTHSNSSLAVTNDIITINLETDVSLSQIPSFQLKSAGIDLSGNVEIIGSDFNWAATYIVEEEATNGAFTFVIDVSGTENADNQFTQANITNGISVSIVTSPIPTISGVSVSNNNNARITFSEDVYTTSAGAGDLQVTDFELFILSGNATLSSSTPLAITKNSATEYDLSFSATVGNYHSEIMINVANDSSIFNLNGLPLDAGYAHNNKANLTDTFALGLHEVSITSTNKKTGYAWYGYNDIVILSIKCEEIINQPTVVFKSGGETVNGTIYYSPQSFAGEWIAYYTVNSADTAGVVTFTIDYTDINSFVGTQVTNVTDGTNIQVVSGTHSETLETYTTWTQIGQSIGLSESDYWDKDNVGANENNIFEYNFGNAIILSGDGKSMLLTANGADNENILDVIGDSDSGLVICFKLNENNQWEQKGNSILGNFNDDPIGQYGKIALNYDGTFILYAHSDSSNYLFRLLKYNLVTKIWETRMSFNVSDTAKEVSMNKDGTILALGIDGASNKGLVLILTYRLFTSADVNNYNYSSIDYSDSQSLPLIITDNFVEPLVGNYYYTQTAIVGHFDTSLKIDEFGDKLRLSQDGLTFITGAHDSHNVSGDNDDEGAVFAYTYDGTGWVQKGFAVYGEGQDIDFGHSMDANLDCTRFIAGSDHLTNTTTLSDLTGSTDSIGDLGYVRVFEYREFTSNDSGKYHYSSQEQNSNQLLPVIATENSTTDPVVGNSYWMQLGFTIHNVPRANESDEMSVVISNDGNTIAIGNPAYDGVDDDMSNPGRVRVFEYREFISSDVDNFYYSGFNYGGTQTLPVIVTEYSGKAPIVGNFYWIQKFNDLVGSANSRRLGGPEGASGIGMADGNMILTKGISDQWAIEARASSYTVINSLPNIPTFISYLDISSNNTDTSKAIVGDIITVDMHFDDNLTNAPEVTLKSNNITFGGEPIITGSNNAWKSEYTVTHAEVDGAVTFSINAGLYMNSEFTESDLTTSNSVTLENIPGCILNVTQTNNTNIHVTFSEEVFNTSGASGDLETSDFVLAIESGEGVLTSSTPSAISKVNNSEYDLSFSVTQTNIDATTLSVNPVDGASIYDTAGDALVSPQVLRNTVALTDSVNPSLSKISLSSNNSSNSRYALSGDIVSLDISASEAILQPTVVFKSGNESVYNSVIYTGSDASWNASYTIHSSDTLGPVTFTINYTDLVSNSGIEGSVTTDNTSVTLVSDVLQISPSLVGLTHTYTQSANNSSQGKNYVSAGDSYVIYAEFQETLATLPVIDISIGGNSIAQNGYIFATMTYYTNPVAEQYNGSNDKQYRWNLDLEQYMGDGDITYTIDVSYSYIKVTHTNDEITDSSVFTPVKSGPIYENVVTVGLNGVRVTFNKDVFTESDGTGDLVINTFAFHQTGNTGSVYLNSEYPTSVTKVTDSIYDLSYDLVGAENNTSAFLLAVYKRTAALIYDASGLLFSTPYKGTTFLYDSTVVNLTSVSIASDNSSKTMFASYYTNDTVTLSFTSSESLYGTPVVSFTAGGADISGNVTVSGSGTAWTASYLVDQVDTLGLVGFTIDFTDGYNSQQVTATTDNSKVTTVGTFTGDFEVTVATTTTANQQLGDNITKQANGDGTGYSCAINGDGTIVAVGGVTSADNGTNSGEVRVYIRDVNNTTTAPVGWSSLGSDIMGEADNDYFGNYCELSDDGSIIAISSSNNNDNGSEAGHVRVWQYSTPGVIGGYWTQIGQDIDGEAADDFSGTSLSLSSDGSIVAIGSYYNDGSTGTTSDNRGHVRIWKYNGVDTWTQLGSDIEGATQDFTTNKHGLSLNSDGDIVAIGYMGNDDAANYAGCVKIFKYTTPGVTGGIWEPLGSINGSAENERFGYAVSLTSDGSIVAIGNIGSSVYGLVRIYQYSNSDMTTGGSWNKIGDDIASTQTQDYFGSILSINSTGSIVAIGAMFYTNTLSNQGMVRIYERDESASIGWSPLGSDHYGLYKNKYLGYMVRLNSAGSIVIFSASNDGHAEVFETGAPGTTTETQTQTVPAIPPVISSLGILSNNTLSTSHATDGNTITVSMTYDENLTQSPTVTFQSGGLDVALSTTISGSDATYTASYVVDPNDTQGDVTFVIDASGTLADTNDTQLEITDGSSMEMLDSPPTFSSVTNEINKNISIEFSTDVYNTNTVSGDLETSDFVLAVESGDVTLTSTTPSAISKVSNKIYDLSFSLTETITTNGPVVSINPVDSTSIYNSVGFAMIAPQTTDNSFNLIDRVPPSLTSVSIVSNNTYKTKYASYFAPDTVTLTLTASENINQPVVTFTVDDVPVTDTINYSGSGASWTISFVVTSSTPLGNLSFSIDYTDTTDGNAGTTVTSTTDATKMIIVGAVVTSTSTVQSDNFEQYGQTLFGPASSGDRYFVSTDINNDGTIMVTSNQYTLDPVFGDNLRNVVVYEFDGASWTQKGSSLYQSSTSLGSVNSGDNNIFGASVSINSAGDIIAIGESGYETLTQLNNSIYSYGAVHIFQYDGNDWIQMGNSIVGSTNNTAFGTNVKLSSDGLTVFSSSSNYPNNSYNGKVEIYTYNSSNTTWELKGNAIEGGQSGEKFATFSIDITSNGLTFAASSFMYEDAEDVIVGKAQVYTYNAVDNSFNQVGQTLYGTDANNKILYIALSDDGTVLATARSLDDTPENNAGTVIVYKYDGASWNQIGQTIYGTNASDTLGWQGGIACNADGSQILIGARTDENYTDTGSVSLYEYDGTDWNLVSILHGTRQNQYANYFITNNSFEYLTTYYSQYAPDGTNKDGILETFKRSTTTVNQGYVLYPPDAIAVTVDSNGAHGTSVGVGETVSINIDFDDVVYDLSNISILIDDVSINNPFTITPDPPATSFTISFVISESDPSGNITFSMDASGALGVNTITHNLITDGSSMETDFTLPVFTGSVSTSTQLNNFDPTYLQGFLDISGAGIRMQNDSKLFIGGDVSLAGNMFIDSTNSVKINTTENNAGYSLDVLGNTDLSGNITIAGDIDVSGNVVGIVNYNTINKDIPPISNSAIDYSDNTDETALPVGIKVMTSDNSFNSTTATIHNDLSANGNFGSTFIFDNSLSVAGSVLVSDLSQNSYGAYTIYSKKDSTDSFMVGKSASNVFTIVNQSNVGVFMNSDSNVLTSTSDKNLKTNISNLENNSDNIMKLRPVEFNWNYEEDNKKKHVGFIAQEVEEIFPELVEENVYPNGEVYKGVNTNKLIPYMIDEIKLLEEKLEKLEKIK